MKQIISVDLYGRESSSRRVESSQRDAIRDGEIARKETVTSGVKHIWGSQLKSAPERERERDMATWTARGQSIT